MKTHESLVNNEKPNIVYKKEIANKSCNPKFTCDNTMEFETILRNLRFKELNSSRLSQLYNLHEIAYDLPNFVRKITTFPDLIYTFVVLMSSQRI